MFSLINNFKSEKPWVRVNMAQTLDGHIIFPSGGWQTTTSEDRRRMDRIRSWADALIVSRSTVNNDNPKLFNRSKPQKSRQPKLQIVMRTNEGSIRSDAQIFSPPHNWGNFWINKMNPSWGFLKNYSLESQKKIQKYWCLKSFSDPYDILRSLFFSGYRNILIEGGPALNGLFFSHDLVDEIFLTKVPYLFGGTTTDRIVVTDSMFTPQKFRLRRVEYRKNEIYLRYIRY